MIISLNWIKKFTQVNGTVDELATLIGSRLVEIEAVENLGEKYKGVIVARVVECAPLEGSDHLNVTKIDDGGVAEGVERDENGLVQVVCGAPNVRQGLLVAWLPPQSVVPETFGDSEPFVLGAKPLRGVMSNGMLASARELDLYDDHSGILELDKDAAPGTSFAELYELNDYLFDIENKSLTHRPDAFGVVGFAREIADWEMTVGLQMELVMYKAMYIRDVNNYYSVYDDNETVKMKGAYEFQDLAWHKNFSALIVPMAVKQAVLHGIDYKQFVKSHKDAYDFMLRVKVPRNCSLVLVDEETENQESLQNVCRYYPSEQGGKLIKIMPPLEGSTEFRRMNVESNWKVMPCNDMSKFNWNINYEYYYQEIEKLIEPFNQQIEWSN
jgi:tRNA-binding EMAP/Myf-like protein